MDKNLKRAISSAYKNSSRGELDEAVALVSKWRKKETIARNKLAQAIANLQRNMRIEWHVLEALRHTAALPCVRHNCGTVCKCGPCHARIALPYVERKEERRRVKDSHES